MILDQRDILTMARQLAVIAIAMIAYVVFTRVSSITKRPSTVNG